GLADEIGQAVLDVEMDVLALDRPGEDAAADLAQDLRHAALDGGQVGAADDADGREHARVRERTLDVEFREPLVEIDRRVEALREAVDRLAEPSRPRLAGGRRLVVFLHGIGGGGQMGDRGEYKSDGYRHSPAELLQ